MTNVNGISKVVKKEVKMFDFFTIRVDSRYSEQLFNNSNLIFEMVTSSDGVIRTTEQGFIKYKAQFMGFDILIWQHLIKPHRIEIRGSFHKLWEGGTNYKDFCFLEFKSTVSILCDSLGIAPLDMNVHSFEIGLNILSPINTSTLLNGIKTLSGKTFDRDSFQGNGLEIRFEFTHYLVKIYNKGLQYNLPEQILRFELKVKKMQYIQTKGGNITTLENFLSGEWNQFFGALLIRQWENIILCPEGSVDPGRIDNRRTRENFINGLNPNYWLSLDSRKYNKQSKRFNEVVVQLSPIDLHTITKDRFRNKWIQLSTYQKDKYYHLHKGNINPIDTNQPTQRYFCKGCGSDISHQKTSHKFCSEKYVGYKKAHNCRNMISNPIHSAKRKKERRKARENKTYPGLTLFPIYIHFGFM